MCGIAGWYRRGVASGRQDGDRASVRHDRRSSPRRHFAEPQLRGLDPLEQFMLADITVYMPGSLLNRLDRESMAASLEARVPFLGHKFVE